jgi:hypothetical protein
MSIEKLKVKDSKIKFGSIHTFRTIKKSYELRLTSPQTQQRNPEHIFKF